MYEQRRRLIGVLFILLLGLVARSGAADSISFRTQLRTRPVEPLAACSGVFTLSTSSTSVHVGDSFVLGWCDPSYFQSGDNSFSVNSYSVYYSQNPNSGFQIVSSGIPSTVMGVQIHTDATDAGLTYYFFVRAIGSGETIAGPMPRSEDSNVVSVSVNPAAQQCTVGLNQCATNFFCLPSGCGSNTGNCTATPVNCPQVISPVCGCDNVTYNNACYASRAGVAVKSQGACSSSNGCSADARTLCLLSRFQARAQFRRYGSTTLEDATATSFSNTTGFFTTVNPGDVDVVVKMVDFCSRNNSWSVYIGGTTDLEVDISITDSNTGHVYNAANPLGNPWLLIRQVAFSCP